MKRADEFIANFPSFFNGRMKSLQIVKEWDQATYTYYRWVVIRAIPKSQAMQNLRKLALLKRFLNPFPSRLSQIVVGSLSAESVRDGTMYLYLAQNVLDECEDELTCIVTDYERQMPAEIVVIPIPARVEHRDQEEET